MCTFQDKRTVLICPVAIDRVRARLYEAFGEIIQCTSGDGQATLVQAPPIIDSARFQAVTREAIAQAQDFPPVQAGAEQFPA
jgi:hypothetical protein